MASKSKKTSPVQKVGSQEKFVRGNMMTIILSAGGLLTAVAIIAGWVTPVTDKMVGRPPFASQVMLEDLEARADMKVAAATQKADQAFEKSVVLQETLMYIQLDRAINQLSTARDRVSRAPADRDAQADALRAESILRQIEERVKRYEQGQTSK